MVEWNTQTLRSLLFTPGNHERRLAKVGTFDSDAIVLDLEDAVADADKDDARGSVRKALPNYPETPVVMVRVNSHETGRMEDDVVAIACSDLDCVMVPKIESPETLQRCDALLYALERERNIAPGQIRLLGLVETPRGLIRCEEIALAAPARTLTLAFGLGDFSTEIQVDPTVEGNELLYARGKIVVAVRAAGMRAPIDGPYLDIHDDRGLSDSTRISRGLGFEGRVVVYPGQVDIVQQVYAELPEDEAEAALRIVKAFEAAEQSGSASIQVDGRFVDYPIYDRARQKLRLHKAARSNTV